MATPTKKGSRTIPRQRDEDEDEAPAPTRMRAAAKSEEDEPEEEGEDAPQSSIRRGFSAARQVADSTSSFAQAFKLDDKIQVIKFLEDEPYASYTRHWIERMGANGQRSSRSYNCMKNFGRECPLCDAGDKAQAVSAFNVALIGDDGVPTLKTFDCGPKLLNIVENYARDPKVAPISKGYFLASKSGKKGTVNYQINPVRATALSEDYDIEAPSAAELKKLGLYDAEIITMPKNKDMEELAAEIADEY